MIHETALFLLLAVAAPGFGQTFKVDSIANPSGPGSLQANWSATPNGPLLSWVEKAKDGSHTLRYAVRRASEWSEARSVAANRRFFRHPAESPEVIALSDGSLLAHWIEMPNESSEAEFVYVSASRDGVHWTPSVMAHKDRSPVQHGLASAVASGNREASLFWLEALQGEDGPTSLKRSVVDAEGKLIKEESLDSDVCACCPTAAVKTEKGLLVAYRGHTRDDIRDISVLRLENGRWSPSKTLYPDKWKLNACPTNAAAAAAKGDQVAVAWYTSAQDSPKVEIVFSKDGGSTFSKPVIMSTGHAYGYTSVALDDEGGALVSWLEQAGNSARVLVRPVAAGGAAGPVTQVAQGSRQSLGYPRLLHAGKETWISWGNSDADAKVQTARLTK